MNIGPQLVHLHVTEEQDYALGWTLGKHKCTVRQAEDFGFQLTVVTQLVLSV